MSATGKLKIWPYPVQMFEELEDLIIISYHVYSKSFLGEIQSLNECTFAAELCCLPCYQNDRTNPFSLRLGGVHTQEEFSNFLRLQTFLVKNCLWGWI